MPRKHAIAVAALVVVSAALAIPVVTLWLRARSSPDAWFIEHDVPPDHLFVTWVRLTPHDLVIEHHFQPAHPQEERWVTEHFRGERLDEAQNAVQRLRPDATLGFAHRRSITRFANTQTGLPAPSAVYDGFLVPMWAVLLASVSPVLVITVVLTPRALVRRRRRRLGRCMCCGYDLRASADRCPECGLAAESEAAA
jgi:hypothetical protein